MLFCIVFVRPCPTSPWSGVIFKDVFYKQAIENHGTGGREGAFSHTSIGVPQSEVLSLGVSVGVLVYVREENVTKKAKKEEISTKWWKSQP